VVVSRTARLTVFWVVYAAALGAALWASYAALAALLW